jgi:LCP family protein required for cell wall assembly
MPDEGEPPAAPERKDPPEYNVYRSRPSLRDRLSKPGLDGLKQKLGRGGDGDGGDKPPKRPSLVSEADERPLWKRIAKWAGIAALGWIVLSFLAFALSAQIQKGKLANGITEELDGNPFLAVKPQTILVLGTDVRSEDFAGPAESEGENCLEDVTGGKGNAPACDHGPYRSDTILLIRAGATTFRKLSIPRDTLANLPGHGEEKINSAYALGGAKLTIRTVEDLLGIDIDQIAIIDFDGFRKFIDTIGGIDVDLPTDVCSTVSGGAFNLNLKKGENHLNGFQAITLARTRDNTCSSGEFAGRGDLERAQFQQLILNGIKGKLTSITSLPMNFIKGPLIAWEAPKTMVSSMGGLTMPQLVVPLVLGGGGDTDILTPSGATPAGNLIVSPEECLRAAKTLLGEDPPRKPNCPQS